MLLRIPQVLTPDEVATLDEVSAYLSTMSPQNSLLLFGDDCGSRYNLARCAIAALIAVVRQKCCLHRAEVFDSLGIRIAGNSLDRDDHLNNDKSIASAIAL